VACSFASFESVEDLFREHFRSDLSSTVTQFAQTLARTEANRYDLHVTTVFKPNFLVMQAKALRRILLSAKPRRIIILRESREFSFPLLFLWKRWKGIRLFLSVVTHLLKHASMRSSRCAVARH
jgi:hypothetical protein